MSRVDGLSDETAPLYDGLKHVEDRLDQIEIIVTTLKEAVRLVHDRLTLIEKNWE